MAFRIIVFEESSREVSPKNIIKRVTSFQSIRKCRFGVVQQSFSFTKVVGAMKQKMSSCFDFSTTAAYRVQAVLKTVFELMIS